MITFKPLFGYMAYHKINKNELVEKIGLSKYVIREMSKGIVTSGVNTSDIDKMCSAFNLSIKEVMRFDPDVSEQE